MTGRLAAWASTTRTLRALDVVGDEMGEPGVRSRMIERHPLVRDRIEQQAAGLQAAKMRADGAERVLTMFEEMAGRDEVLARRQNVGERLSVIDDVDWHQFQVAELGIMPPQARDVEAVDIDPPRR